MSVLWFPLQSRLEMRRWYQRRAPHLPLQSQLGTKRAPWGVRRVMLTWRNNMLAARIKTRRRGLTLGDIRVRDLINEGRDMDDEEPNERLRRTMQTPPPWDERTTAEVLDHVERLHQEVCDLTLQWAYAKANLPEDEQDRRDAKLAEARAAWRNAMAELRVALAQR